MLTTVGSGEGLRGGEGGLSGSSISSSGSSLIWIWEPPAPTPGVGLSGRGGYDGWRLGRGPMAEDVTGVWGCDAAEGAWDEVMLFPGRVCTWEITGRWVGRDGTGRGCGMSWRGGGGAPGGCWLGRELRGFRAGGGGRLEGIWGKGVADWCGICLCEVGIGVVGGGLICGPDRGGWGSWDSLKKGGGRWGACGDEPWGCAELRAGGTWNAGEITESWPSAEGRGGGADRACEVGGARPAVAAGWLPVGWGGSGEVGGGLWAASAEGALCVGWGAEGGLCDGRACGAGVSTNTVAGGTGSNGTPFGWAEESESLSLPCWGLGMLGEELRLSWSMSLVSLLPSSWALRLSEELSSSTSASPSEREPCGS